MGKDHASGDGVVGEFVDEDDASGDTVGAVGIEEERLGGAELKACNVIEADFEIVFDFVEGVDVDLIADFADNGFDFPGGVTEDVFATGLEFFLGIKPTDHDLEVLADGRLVMRFGEHVAAADIDFIFERDGDGHR